MDAFVILGRGGQGAQTAGNQLARAFFSSGKYVQTFATYGGARRGTPVSVSIRADDRPIRLRSNVAHGDGLLCFDDSLLEASFLSLADARTVIVVNSAKPRGAFANLTDFDIRPINGLAIAQRHGLGKVINSALLGAFAARVGAPDINVLAEVIEATAPAMVRENVAACREAFTLMRESDLEVAS